MDLDQYIEIIHKRRSQRTAEDEAFLKAWEERRTQQQVKNTLELWCGSVIAFLFQVTAAFFVWQFLSWIFT